MATSCKLCHCVLSCVLFLPVGGTPAQSTCRERHWAEEGAPAPWTSWRTSPGLLVPAVAGLSLQTGSMSGITALPGVATEMRMMDGADAAPHHYHRREETHGTAIAPVDCLKARDMTTPTSAVFWRARRGGGEGTEALVDRTRTVTLPLKAAPEGRGAIVTTAGRLATVQRRRTLCLRTPSGRRSGTAGLTRPLSGTALQNLPDQSDTGPLNQPWSLSLTPVPTRGCPTRCRGAETREKGAETWWVTCSRNMDFSKEHLNPVNSYTIDLSIFYICLIFSKSHEKPDVAYSSVL